MRSIIAAIFLHRCSHFSRKNVFLFPRSKKRTTHISFSFSIFFFSRSFKFFFRELPPLFVFLTTQISVMFFRMFFLNFLDTFFFSTFPNHPEKFHVFQRSRERRYFHENVNHDLNYPSRKWFYNKHKT